MNKLPYLFELQQYHFIFKISMSISVESLMKWSILTNAIQHI